MAEKEDLRMTVTYNIANNIGKVRLKISDTVTTDYVFTDEEITYFLTENSNSINLAAADALDAWAAKYAANADSETIGDYKYTQKSVDKMTKLAQRFRDTESGTPYMTWSEPDLTNGSGITEEGD